MDAKSGVIPLLLIAAAYAGYQLFLTETWVGFYYPRPDDRTVVVQSGKLKTFDACKAWVDETHVRYGKGTPYDFECGHGCMADANGTYVCQDVMKN